MLFPFRYLLSARMVLRTTPLGALVGWPTTSIVWISSTLWWVFAQLGAAGGIDQKFNDPRREKESAVSESPQAYLGFSSWPNGRKAVVTVPQTFVRSGPGLGFYPTQILDAGAEVEIYGQDPNGWLAIRPPEGSFSWVRTEDIEIGDDGLAEVIRDGAPSLIGSLLSSERSFSSVKLRRGELLRVLELPVDLQGDIAPLPGGALRRSSAAGSASTGGKPRWCKISPPSGEFRWVEARAVQFVSEVDGATPTGREASEFPSYSESARDLNGPDSQPQRGWQRLNVPMSFPPRQGLSREGVLGSRPAQVIGGEGGVLLQAGMNLLAASPGDKGSEALADSSGRQGASPGGQGTPKREWIARAEPSPENLASKISIVKSSGGLSPQERVDELSLRFAEMLLRSPGEWQFDELRLQVERLMQELPGGTLQSEVRTLATRITRAEEIRKRFLAAKDLSAESKAEITRSIGPGDTERQAEPFRGVDSSVGLAIGATSEGKRNWAVPASASSPWPHSRQPMDIGDERFDAVGRLMRVVPASWGTPRYALVDQAGNIRAFVTPAPSVSLEYYLGTQVGINGTCSVYGAEQVPHVLARSVVPLQSLSKR